MGLIPAHAGKTRVVPNVVCETGAHPRSRGENLARLDSGIGELGSSPLTRGKRAWQCIPSPQPGLIPAHAGKTLLRSYPARTTAAHPRSRGENSEFSSLVLQNFGSSPLTRGKRPLRRVQGLQGRLIPAHAGKTRAQSLGCYDNEAHPRSRGEN